MLSASCTFSKVLAAFTIAAASLTLAHFPNSKVSTTNLMHGYLSTCLISVFLHLPLHTPYVLWLLPLHPHITIISQHHLQPPPHCLSGQKLHPTCMYDVCAMSIPIIFDSVGHSVCHCVPNACDNQPIISFLAL